METLEFPEIQSPAAAPVAAQRTEVAAAAAQLVDLAKLDLTDVALAQFGNWRDEVEKTRAKLTGVVWHPETPKGLAELRDVRHKMTRQPRYEGTRIAKALKSKLAQVSKAIGAEDDAQCKAWEELEAPLTKLIDEREAQIEVERAEKDRIEKERKQKHLDNIAVIASYVDQAAGLPIDRIEKGIAYVQGIDVSAQVFEEFAARAAEQKQVTIERMQQMVVDLRAQAAAEALRLENERIAAELAEQRRLMAEQQAEIERQRKELEAAQQRAAAPVPAQGTDDAPAQRDDGTADTQAPEREAAPIMRRPYEGWGQVDGCRAPESQPVLCSGQHPQDQTSLPASPTSTTVVWAFELTAADAAERSPALESSSDAASVVSTPVESAALIAECLELTQYAAAPFAGRFPSHPKPGPEWWAGLRQRIERLQPLLAAAGGIN